MAVDPTLIVAEELNEARASLKAATAQRHHHEVRGLLLEIRLLEEALSELVPTTTKGAGALLRVAASGLAWTEPDYACLALAIAERLEAGERNLPDLVRLRTLTFILERRGTVQAARTVQLLKSVVAGAARPVIAYRSNRKPRSNIESGTRAG